MKSTDPFRNISSWLPAAATVGYLLMVFGGKALMRDRGAMNIKAYVRRRHTPLPKTATVNLLTPTPWR